MATIREHIKATMPRTFEIMDARYPNIAADVGPPAVEEALGIVDSTVSRVFTTLFPTGTIVEGDLSEGSKIVVADLASKELITPTIDHLQHEARISESSGGESITYYDLIKTLQALEAKLIARINATAHLLDVVDENASEIRPSGAVRVSSAGTSFKTMSPSEFAPSTETL